MPIALPEDHLGFDPTEIFVPDIIICGAVLIRLKMDKGFVGMHFTPSTTSAEITLAANYAKANLIPATGILNLVFFVNKEDWTPQKVAAESLVLQTAFGMAPMIMPKPTNVAAQSSVDVRIHTPVTSKTKDGKTLVSPSWIDVRPHDKTGVQAATTQSPNVFKINRMTNKPTTIETAKFQTLPKEKVKGWQPA